MDKELKPCPFCGGKAKLVEDVLADGLYVVDCLTPMCYSHESGNSIDEAMKNWNTRPIEDGLVAQLLEKDREIERLKEYEWKYNELCK